MPGRMNTYTASVCPVGLVHPCGPCCTLDNLTHTSGRECRVGHGEGRGLSAAGFETPAPPLLDEDERSQQGAQNFEMTYRTTSDWTHLAKIKNPADP
jgi:hypothetical protein